MFKPNSAVNEHIYNYLPQYKIPKEHATAALSVLK